MIIESACIKGICALSFSLASSSYYGAGDLPMAWLTGIAGSVSAILFLRELMK